MTSAFAVGIFIAFTGLGRKILGLISAACCAVIAAAWHCAVCVCCLFSPRILHKLCDVPHVSPFRRDQTGAQLVCVVVHSNAKSPAVKSDW